MPRGRPQRRRVDKAKAGVNRLAFNERGTLSPEKGGLEGRKLERQASLGRVGQGTEVIHASKPVFSQGSGRRGCSVGRGEGQERGRS